MPRKYLKSARHEQKDYRVLMHGRIHATALADKITAISAYDAARQYAWIHAGVVIPQLERDDESMILVYTIENWNRGALITEAKYRCLDTLIDLLCELRSDQRDTEEHGADSAGV